MKPVCQFCGAPAQAAKGIAVESAASAAKMPFLARITCNPDPLDGDAAGAVTLKKKTNQAARFRGGTYTTVRSFNNTDNMGIGW